MVFSCSNGLDKGGVVVLGRVYPRAHRRRYEMRIGVLLEQSESVVWGSLKPYVAVLTGENRRHSLLGVVNLAHQLARRHGDDGAALNSRAVVSL